MIQPLTNTNSVTEPEKLREVRYEYSNNLAAILDRLQISLFFFDLSSW